MAFPEPSVLQRSAVSERQEAPAVGSGDVYLAVGNLKLFLGWLPNA